MFLCFLPKPGYHESTSIWEGKCKKKGSNRMSRSQRTAIIPCKINRRITFHRGPARDRRCFHCFQTIANSGSPIRCPLKRKMACVDSHKACRFRSSIPNTGWRAGRTTRYEEKRSVRSGKQQSPKVLGRTKPRSGLKTPTEESTRMQEVDSRAQVTSEKDLFWDGRSGETRD